MTQASVADPSSANDHASRLRALRLANEIRRTRARLKRQIAAGELSAAEVILDPPSQTDSWPIGDLLLQQRGWGLARSKRLLSRSAISELTPLGRLTERQRTLRAARFQHAAPRARRRELTRR